MQHIHENTHLLNALTLTLFESNRCRQRSTIEKAFCWGWCRDRRNRSLHWTEHAHTYKLHTLTFFNTHRHTCTGRNERLHINARALLPLPQPALSLSCTSLLPLCSLHFIILPSHPFLSSPSYLPLSSDPVFPIDVCKCVRVQTCCLYVRLPGQCFWIGGMTVRGRFALSTWLPTVWCTCTHSLSHLLIAVTNCS